MNNKSINRKNTDADRIYYPEVSLLKGTAILAVITCHVCEAFVEIDKLIYYAFSVGQMACQLFFMASALLLSFSYSTTNPSYGQFLRKRWKRIVPPYWGAIFISVVFCIIGPYFKYTAYSHITSNPLKVVINLLLLNGLTPYGNNDVVFGGWFVGTAAVYYLLFPILFKIHNHLNKHIKRTGVYLLILLCVQAAFAITLRIANITCQPLSFIYFSIFNQLTSFWIGFVLYDLYIENRIKEIKRPLLKFIILIISALLLYAGGYFVGWRDTFVFAPLIFAFSYLFLFAFTNQCFDKKAAGSKACKLVSALGNRSYGIYLTNLYFIYPLCKPLLMIILVGINIPAFLCFLALLTVFVPICCTAGIIYDEFFDRFLSKSTRA